MNMISRHHERFCTNSRKEKGWKEQVVRETYLSIKPRLKEKILKDENEDKEQGTEARGGTESKRSIAL